MKCLSISQPFAELILIGKKTIELRNWNTKFRGEFLIHSPLKIRKADCKRLKISTNLVTGAIVGKAELIDVKKYHSKKEVTLDRKYHFASKEHLDRKYGFVLKNPKRFRVPIYWKGQLNFFDVELPRSEINNSELVSDIIDEEYRYQWIGHH